MTQAFYDGFPWKIYRGRGGWPRWWQRFHEAWLVITGRYTFWHAWHDGKHRGSADEFQRIIFNGGDLLPVMRASIEVTYKHAMDADVDPDVAFHLTTAAWKRYRETLPTSSVSPPPSNREAK